MQLEHQDLKNILISTGGMLVQTIKLVKYIWELSKGKWEFVPLHQGL